jgi:hypothetical protein
MKPETRTELLEFFRPPAWTTGHISLDDAGLLAELIEGRIERPMLEIGVASGWSSAVLLHLLQRHPPRSEGPVWLHSYDVGEWCYFDQSRRVGAAVAEVVPSLAGHWRLHVGNAIDAGMQHRDNPVDLAFVDADHRHPWATIDLLALLPALAPNAWVALHDINLPLVAPKAEWRVYGPKNLFDLWPWEKRVAAGEQRNIGAVRVPADHEEVRRFCATVLERPWETSLPAAIIASVGLAEMPGYRIDSDPECHGLARRLHDLVTGGRPVFLWGAGGAGRAFLKKQVAVRSLASAFIDSSVAKHGTKVEGLPIVSPEAWSVQRPRPFVLVTSQFSAEIVRELETRGAKTESDYLVMPI